MSPEQTLYKLLLSRERHPTRQPAQNWEQSQVESERESGPTGTPSCPSLRAQKENKRTLWNPCANLGEQCLDYMGYTLTLSQIGNFFFQQLFSNGWGVIHRRAPYQVHSGCPRVAVQGISSLSSTVCRRHSEPIIMPACLPGSQFLSNTTVRDQ